MTIRVKNIYIILFIIVIIILIFVYHGFIRFQQKNAYNYRDTFDNNNVVMEIYKKYPQLFSFAEDGECIISVSDLLIGQSEYDFDIMHDEDGNDCMGYYIINKDLNNNIDIDSSHICDMIDY